MTGWMVIGVCVGVASALWWGYLRWEKRRDCRDNFWDEAASSEAADAFVRGLPSGKGDASA